MDNTGLERRIVLVRKRKVIVARDRKGKSIGSIVLSRLLPFRKAMMISLNRIGINTSNLNFKTLVILYYNEFSGRPPLSVSSFINNFCFRISPNDETIGDRNDARNISAVDEINDVVDSVISIFKNSKKRYDTLLLQGISPRQLMTEESIVQANAARQIELSLLKKSKGDHFIKASTVTTWFKWIAGIAIVGYLFFRK